MKWQWIAALAGVAVGLWWLSRRDDDATGSVDMSGAMLPRGIRNNNPFNIKITGIPWNGKRPKHENTDGTFEQFETPMHGIRAGVRDIWTKFTQHGLRSIRGILMRFAPPIENNTAAYIQAVSMAVGKGPDDELTIHDFPALARAIITHENGAQYRDWYPESLIMAAIMEATGYDLN